jgi:hypothetical protein
MGYDPKGCITRPDHFTAYKAGCGGAPPPLHVISSNPLANHYPLSRPLEAGPAEPGPALILGGAAEDCLGIDPTDPATWEGRGYRQSAGMIGRFNRPDDWLGIPPPAGQGVRPS